MLKKSFFNPFSALLLALAVLALFVDVLPRPQGEADIFAPVVLFLMWLMGGLVRLFYEEEARRTFERHMSRAKHTMVWKQDGECWSQVDANLLAPGDVVRISAGMLCPVDVSLNAGKHILVSEASLTGESGFSVKEAGDVTTVTDGAGPLKPSSR